MILSFLGAKEEVIYETKNDNPIYREKSRTTKHQLLPIYLRVTTERKRFEVATDRHAKPSDWSPTAGKVKARSEIAIETNMVLDEIRKKVYEYKDQIGIENRNFYCQHTLGKMV